MDGLLGLQDAEVAEMMFTVALAFCCILHSTEAAQASMRLSHALDRLAIHFSRSLGLHMFAFHNLNWIRWLGCCLWHCIKASSDKVFINKICGVFESQKTFR